ncbi:hypothetical protein E2320_005861 [Naja naja]|nr:hypothetical protein E2320_005861 [Naja naja]
MAVKFETFHNVKKPVDFTVDLSIVLLDGCGKRFIRIVGYSSNHIIKTKAKQTPAGNIILVVTQKQKVCAEAYNPDEEEDDTELRVIHPKTDDQRNRLQEACKDILLFKNLDQEQMSQVLDAIGNYNIVVKCDGVGRCVGTYDNRGSFGELALIVTFRRIIVKNNAKKRRMYENFIESLPFLKSLELSERLKVVDVIGTKIYKDGEQIIAQGDTADSFFIVESGEVKITMKRKGKQDIDGKEAVEIARYTRGQYFGELALQLRDVPSVCKENVHFRTLGIAGSPQPAGDSNTRVPKNLVY